MWFVSPYSGPPHIQVGRYHSPLGEVVISDLFVNFLLPHLYYTLD